MKHQYLFAYGFLQTQFSVIKSLEVPPMPVTKLGYGKSQGSIYRVAAYPGMKLTPKSKNKVSGQVFIIKQKPFFLKSMDRYELAHPEIKSFYEYKRIAISVSINKTEIKCWAYLYIPPVLPFSKIHSGIFS